VGFGAGVAKVARQRQNGFYHPLFRDELCSGIGMFVRCDIR
jgi:hypothetical protein